MILYLIHIDLTLSSLIIFRQYFTLSFLLRSSIVRIHFFSLGFMLYFLSFHKEETKAIKFIVVLFIYKSLFVFPFGLEIYYLFNKG